MLEIVPVKVNIKLIFFFKSITWKSLFMPIYYLISIEIYPQYLPITEDRDLSNLPRPPSIESNTQNTFTDLYDSHPCMLTLTKNHIIQQIKFRSQDNSAHFQLKQSQNQSTEADTSLMQEKLVIVMYFKINDKVS